MAAKNCTTTTTKDAWTQTSLFQTPGGPRGESHTEDKEGLSLDAAVYRDPRKHYDTDEVFWRRSMNQDAARALREPWYLRSGNYLVDQREMWEHPNWRLMQYWGMKKTMMYVIMHRLGMPYKALDRFFGSESVSEIREQFWCLISTLSPWRAINWMLYGRGIYLDEWKVKDMAVYVHPNKLVSTRHFVFFHPTLLTDVYEDLAEGVQELLMYESTSPVCEELSNFKYMYMVKLSESKRATWEEVESMEVSTFLQSYTGDSLETLTFHFGLPLDYNLYTELYMKLRNGYWTGPFDIGYFMRGVHTAHVYDRESTPPPDEDRYQNTGKLLFGSENTLCKMAVIELLNMF